MPKDFREYVADSDIDETVQDKGGRDEDYSQTWRLALEGREQDLRRPERKRQTLVHTVDVACKLAECSSVIEPPKTIQNPSDEESCAPPIL
jgi:hypothetical protein